MSTAVRATVMLAALVLPSASATAPVGCSVDGTYHVVSKTSLGGKRIVGLITRGLPNNTRALEVVADAGDGSAGETVASGPLREHDGRWRVRQRAIRPDAPGLHMRLHACERFVGRINSPGRRARRLVAVRTRCGDGFVDRFGDEDCDTSSGGCAVGTCTDQCVCKGSAGLPDATFGTGGRVVVENGPGLIPCVPRFFCPGARVTSIVPNPDGTVLVVGSAPTTNGSIAYLHRLRPDGSIDSAFHPTTVGGPAALVRLMNDGRIAWVQGASGTPRFAMRFLQDGTRDQTFASADGSVGSVTDAGPTPDGGIVAVGDAGITLWGTDGVAEPVDLPAGWTPFAVDDVGRVLAFHANDVLLVRRFTTLGAIDPTFGGGQPVCVARQSLGRIVDGFRRLADASIVVGLRTGDARRIVRIPADGDGIGANCAPEPPSIAVPAMPDAVQADGKYLAMSADALLRLLPDGARDLDFARLGSFEPSEPVTSVAVDADGRILVGGSSRVQPDLVVRRLLP